VFLEPPPTVANNDVAKQGVQSGAEKLATTLDSQAQGAHTRADGIATTPMLRAAIETDAATVKDMVKDKDMLFKSQAGETVEVFQMHDGKSVSLLRIPENSAAIHPLAAGETRIETDGKGLTIVVGSQVTTQRGATAGVVALATPVDLSQVKQAIATHAKAATLSGLERPVSLVEGTTSGERIVVPVKLSPQTGHGALSLAAYIATPAAVKQASLFAIVRYGCWGLAGLLLLIFLVMRSRR